ncbi:MAG: glycoside hydrolase family 5 protein [Prevotella sp.]|nr:glycoside hydrolase family 5 protein [Prevotella sp.]
MKKILLFVCSLLISMSANAADFESAKDAVKNMGVGWNLGNTLDAHDATRTWTTTAEHETCWGQPVTKPELLKMMKDAGFGAIRVPVTWYQEMDANGKVNDAWMKRVKEVVDYVIDNGMYCLLNVHHDTGPDGGSFKSWIKASGANYTANKDKYEGLWKQIAETFKDYDQHLLFEAYNEMLDEKNTWNEPVDKTDGYKAINDYAKSFVTTVRATGGNNAQRNLVVNTYSASNSPAAMEALELPEETGHIAFQIHNYPDWQNESHARELVDNLISNVKSKLISKGAPVIIGEYATLSTWPERDWYDVDRKVALYAMDYFIKKTKEEGIGTFYWMGLSDGIYRSEPAFNQPDLAETITKAYHGSDFNGVYPVHDATSETVVFEGEKMLEWGTAINFPASLFTDYDNSAVVEVTYTQKYDQFTGDDVYGMMQFWYNDWSEQINFTVDGKEYAHDFVPADHYATESGTDHVTAFSFDQKTFENFKSKGMLFQGHGILVKKAVLTKSPSTGISKVNMPETNADAAIYTLSGQRVASPRKGIYIQNGKKIIVK